MVKQIHIVGRKNSGKTSLIVDLVKYLTRVGHQVGTIKHTHHHHELDTPGKDSHRHREAGAAAVAILSPDMNAVFWPSSTADDIARRYERILHSFPTCDLVLVEGHSQIDGCKVEVWRAAVAEDPIAKTDPAIRGIVTDDEVDLNVPVLKRSDVASIARFLLELPSD